MYQQRISTSESPHVKVTACQGDLTVVTWANSEVLIEVDSEEVLTVEEQEDEMALAANGNCRLTVPTGALLNVVQVQGDLSVEGASGTVEVATVQGDTQFRNGTGNASLSSVQANLLVEDWTGAVNAETVQGDARARQVGGDVTLGTVGGDLTATGVSGALATLSVGGDVYLREVEGPLSLENVGGDLTGRVLLAGADVVQVNGDVSLKTVFAGPHTYRIQAQSNVVVKVLPGSDATFTLQAAEGQIRAKGFTGEKTEEGQWRGVIGDGEAQVTLTSAHGDVTLKAVAEGDQDTVAFVFGTGFGEARATARLEGEELALRIQQRVAEKLSKIDFEAIAQREAERARRQAEREAERALRLAEKAQRRAEQTRKRAESRRGERWHLHWDTEHGPRRAPKQVASDEERLAVLKMLAEGKISAEEAETLLQALES
jgi:DUF4097 and DUF4098 domain-containing protein YvlB